MEYSDWRSDLSEAQKCQCEGCDKDPCVDCGENCHDIKEGVLADRLRAQIKDKKKRWDKEGNAAKKAAYKALDDVKASQAAMDAEVRGTDTSIDLKKEEVANEGVGTALALGAAGYGLYKGGKWLKKKGDKALKNAQTRHKRSIEKRAGLQPGEFFEETGLVEWGWADHIKAIEKRKIKNRKAVPYEAMTAKKSDKEETGTWVQKPKSSGLFASHKLEGEEIITEKEIPNILKKAIKKGAGDLSKSDLSSDAVGDIIKTRGKGALKSIIKSKTFQDFLNNSYQYESIERQAKDRKKLSQPHSVSGSRRDHSHDVDSALKDHVPRKGKGRVRPASKKEMRVSAMRDAGISAEIAGKDHSIDLKNEGFGSWTQDKLKKGFKKADSFLEKRPGITKVLDLLVGSGKRKGKNYPTGPDHDKHIRDVKKKKHDKHIRDVRMKEEMSDADFKKFNKDMHDNAKAGEGASQETQNKYALELARRRRINKDGTVSTLTNKEIKANNKKVNEEIEGGVSVETYTKGIQFHDVETVDIIKAEPLKPSPKAAEYSDWRVELG